MKKLLFSSVIILGVIMIANTFIPSSVMAQTEGSQQNVEDTSDDSMKNTLGTNNTNTENSTMSESGQISKRG